MRFGLIYCNPPDLETFETILEFWAEAEFGTVEQVRKRLKDLV